MGKILKQTGFSVFLCAAALWNSVLFAQIHQHAEVHPVLSAIQQEVQTGHISKDEALLQSVYAGYAPERLNSRFRTQGRRNSLIRCLTPVLMEFENTKDQLSSATITEIESLVASNSTATMESHLSPSGNFILHYDTVGQDAVPLEDTDRNGIPDYIEKAASAADSSYRHEVENIGFMDFLKTDPYEIYFLDFGFYGTTRSSGSTTIINIHNNFDGFPENTHPEGNQIGALYATIAHEIKHAIQYATNRWKGEAGNTAWSEMDATLMEEIVFDDVNDYYNYIMQYDNELGDWNREKANSSSIFGNPDNAIPGSYNHITWMLYFVESYGIQFWVDVWDIIRMDYLNTDDPEDLIPFLDAVEQVLNRDGRNLRNEHIKNHLWHSVAGPNLNVSNFGFEEGAEYPNSKLSESLYLPPDDSISIDLKQINALAATYIDLGSSTLSLGQPKFNLQASQTNVGFGVVAIFQDGTTDYLISLDPNLNEQSVQSTWYWKDLKHLRVVVIDVGEIDETKVTDNFNTNSSVNNLSLKVSSVIPANDLIAQNYPNPFNPTTNIKFALTERKDVVVEVYDRIGRKISTLVDNQLGRGFHTVQFNGTGLASGVYFYRIVTDQAVVTRKMVLVK